MESWQAVLMIFFVLLPLVLMLDFWGDERLTARGRPIPRQWQRQIRPDDLAGREAGPPSDIAGRDADDEPAFGGH